MARGLRQNLGVWALAVKAATRSGEISITEVETDGGSAVEFRILRGKMLVGRISAFLDEPEHPDEVRAGALHAAAGVASLAISAVDASETMSARRRRGAWSSWPPRL